MLADGSHGRVGSGADVVVHQLPDPLTQVILYVQLPDQLSNHVVLESTKRERGEDEKRWICPCLPILLEEPCVVHSGQNGLWPSGHRQMFSQQKWLTAQNGATCKREICA